MQRERYSKILYLYRTPFKDWGVRALTDIKKNTFLCEYSGKLLSDEEENILVRPRVISVLPSSCVCVCVCVCMCSYL